MADRIKEVYGRMLSGLAGPSGSEQLAAYEKALGVGKARIKTPTKKDIAVKRMGEWKDPDEGIDVFDFTTDLLPDVPAMVLGGIGAVTGGPAAAVPLAAIGNIAKQQLGKDLGLRNEVSRPEAMLEGGAELLGPIGDALPLAAIGRTVWHGSPHKGIKKFDLSKIGTGSGGSAYMDGIYLAGSENRAARYAYGHGNKQTYIGGEIVPDGTGSLYDVDVDDNIISDMIKWEKKFDEQPVIVKEAMHDMGHTPAGDVKMGAIIDDLITKELEAGGTSGDISRMFNDRGIKGMEFGVGGRSNLVIFDPSIAKIIGEK